MLRYVARRLGSTVLVVLGVSVITFVIFHVVGGDPAHMMLGERATPEAIRELQRTLGLDKPLFVDVPALLAGRPGRAFDSQFADHLRGMLTLDFGRSYETKQEIGAMIRRGLLPSLSLSVPAFAIGTVLALYVALACALYRNSWFDRTAVLLSVLGMSVTSLAVIILAQYLLAYRWGWFPVYGYASGPAAVRYLVLPWLIWVGVSLGANVRFYRTVICEEVDREYVTAAWARGIHPDRILFAHVLRNALVPILTRVIITLPFLYTGSLLLEVYFGIPGLGNMFLKALNAADYPVIKALTFIGSILFVAANLLSDLCCAAVDPRIRVR